MSVAATNAVETAIGGLNFLWLEVTGKCNLTCSHCYAESGPLGELYGNMQYKDWVRVIDEASELGCSKIQFIGGEPTLHPRLNDLIDHANHQHFELIEVYTNATRLGKDLLGCFQRNQVRVATSFYTDEPRVHTRITRSEGSWERTVAGIQSVIAAGLQIRVGVIQTSENHGHVTRAVEFVKGLGVNEVGMDRERGVGRGIQQLSLTPASEFSELCGQCWKGRLCITPSGQAFPCVFSRRFPLGSVASHSLRDILESTPLQSFRTRLRADRARGGHGCNPGCNPDYVDCEPNEPTVDCSPSDRTAQVARVEDTVGLICDCNPDTGDCNPDCAPGNWCGPDSGCEPNDPAPDCSPTD